MLTLHKIVDQRAEALEFKVPRSSSMIGRAIEDIDIKPNILIACVNRKGKIILANGKTVVEAGDSIIVVSTDKTLRDVRDMLNSYEEYEE